MTSAEVAGETKLSPLAIHAMENDRFDELPGRVFVVGYLKAYARCIGLCPDEVVARYDESLGTLAVEPVEETANVPQGAASGSLPMRPLLIGAGVVVLLAVVGWLWLG